MWWKSTYTTDYTSLRNSSNESITEDSKLESSMDLRRLRHGTILLRVAPWLVHFVLILISSILLFRAAQMYEKSQKRGEPVARELPHAVGDVGGRSPLTFDGDFFAHSKYRGSPSPELDAEWEKLYSTGAMAISKFEMLRIQKLVPSSVELPEEPEESYQAGLEVFHQIHCLDMIRRYSYFEHYSVIQPEFARPMMRIHTDHCIEMLRQTLMCNSDLHVYTYNWVDRVEHSWPDFSTTKMCRNFDDVLAWGTNHAAHTSAKEGMPKRPQNASVLHVASDNELGLELESN